MNLDDATAAFQHEFAHDIADGTIDLRSEPDRVVLDGGNWTLSVHTSGAVSLSLPTNDPKYFDENPDAFLDNVLNVEVEQSLAELDRSLGGAVKDGLVSSGESYAHVLAERLEGL